MSKKTRVLVTGSEGFIGKAICQELKKAPDELELITLDRNFSAWTRHIQADISQEDVGGHIREANPGVVVHAAGNVSVEFSVANPALDLQSNALGTVRLLQALNQLQCRNFIYISSGGAINRNWSSNRPDEISKEILSPYALSKFMAEKYIELLLDGDIGWTILALSNCYGNVLAQQRGVIYEFWEKLSNGLPPVIYGADTARDFIHIDDVVRAVLLAIKRPTNARLNISSSVATPLRELLKIMQEILGTKIPTIIEPSRTSDVRISCLDNSLAKNALHWQPSVTLAEGIRSAIQI